MVLERIRERVKTRMGIPIEVERRVVDAELYYELQTQLERLKEELRKLREENMKLHEENEKLKQ